MQLSRILDICITNRVVAPRLGALYPLKEGKSAKDEIYSSAYNPSPLFDIMQQVYAMHLQGTVSVWVQDRSEMSSLRNSIKVNIFPCYK